MNPSPLPYSFHCIHSKNLSAKNDVLVIAEGNCCAEVDWQITVSQPGWTNCSQGRYLTGLWRKSNGGNGGIDHASKGRCCTPPQEYEDDALVCQTVNWTTALSRSVTCTGLFLLKIISTNSYYFFLQLALLQRTRTVYFFSSVDIISS